MISIEYILVASIILVSSFSMMPIIFEEGELSQAISIARSGATQGANINSLALYPEESFLKYEKENQRLLFPSEVRILHIEYKNFGYNSTYRRIRVQIRVHASCPSLMKHEDKNCLGDRINYHVRKSISEAFHTENSTNKLYNPSFSHRYVFTTADVQWH